MIPRVRCYKVKGTPNAWAQEANRAGGDIVRHVYAPTSYLAVLNARFDDPLLMQFVLTARACRVRSHK